MLSEWFFVLALGNFLTKYVVKKVVVLTLLPVHISLSESDLLREDLRSPSLESGRLLFADISALISFINARYSMTFKLFD